MAHLLLIGYKLSEGHYPVVITIDDYTIRVV